MIGAAAEPAALPHRCGAPAYLSKRRVDGSRMWLIHCKRCGEQSELCGRDLEPLIAVWNRTHAKEAA